MTNSIHMETTKISVIKTVSEIEDLLIGHGATRVWKDCDPATRTIESVSFSMVQDGCPVEL